MQPEIINRSAPSVSWEVSQQQNKLVLEWTVKVKEKLRESTAQFTKGKSGTVKRKGGRDEEKLTRSLRHRILNKQGITEGTSFRFERHGVFVHKGVGKGYKMVNGMVFRYAKGQPNPARQPVDWFNAVMDQHVPELANKIAVINADASINALRLRIN